MTEQEAILTESLAIETQLSNDLKGGLARERARAKVLEVQLAQVAEHVRQVVAANQTLNKSIDEKNEEIQALKTEIFNLRKPLPPQDVRGGSEKTA